MKLGNHNFHIRESRFIKEINATVNLYTHQKSGARLIHIDTDDDNKAFCVAFRTPPSDNTGIAHIMEHSVLCGSRKYPAKEPFVELLKGSLYTFLNAMTSSDFTFYPVASRNDKDFRNLVEVYLDAVFFPNIYTKPEILKQEGWHYEMETENDPLTISGVVYNEMKGAYSSPTRILSQEMDKALFPDSIYRFESGGHPDHISELTQQQFEEFHKKYYHPSNAYFYLYGNMNVDSYLKLLDEEALSHFQAVEVNSQIEAQPAFTSPVEKEVFYPVSAEEDDQQKTWYALRFVMDFKDQFYLNFTFEVISQILTETSSPLKQALLKSGIGKDVMGYFDSNSLQPGFTIIIKDAEKGKAEEFKQIVLGTLSEMCHKGIDKDLIEAAINIKEFLLREADFSGNPKGIVYIFNTISHWIHDLNPLEALTYEEMLTSAKQALTTDFFESLIKYYLIDNPYHCLLTMSPKKGLAEEMIESHRKEMETIKNAFSFQEIREIIKDAENLKRIQSTPDLPENVDKIPQLTLSDINRKFEFIPTDVSQKGAYTFLHHPIFTNGIAYINMYFNNMVIPPEDVKYLDILANILGAMSTKNYTYSEITNQTLIHTGGVYTQNKTFNDKENFDDFSSRFTVTTKVLNSKLDKLFNILEEIVFNTRFDDFDRLFEILNQMKSKTEIDIMQRSHSYVSTRLSGYYSYTGTYREQLDGIDQYLFLRETVKNYQEIKETLAIKLSEIAGKIFNINNLVVSFTSPAEDVEHFISNLTPFLGQLNSEELPVYSYQFPLISANEAILTPGKVQYVGKGFSFKKLGYPSHGSYQVLNTLLSLDYLWNNVRVLGGAYGCFLDIRNSGVFQIVSYRDPNLKETLQSYDGISGYLKKVKLSDKELTKYIIGTISKYDPALTPSLKSSYGDFYYFSNQDAHYQQNNRDQIIATTLNQLTECAEMVDKIMQKDRYCILGNESKIKENLDLFQTVIAIFE